MPSAAKNALKASHGVVWNMVLMEKSRDMIIRRFKQNEDIGVSY